LSARPGGHSDKRTRADHSRTRQPAADGSLDSTDSLNYNGWTIIPRTFEIRGSRLWTLDLLIAHRAKHRAFSGPKKFPTERAAIRGCHAFGRRIIDGREPYCSVEDMR
jgi:hypothetical protein